MNTDYSINPSIEMSEGNLPSIEISDQDKENFLKSVLSDRPYEEELSLFGDQLKLKFRIMTVQENSEVVRQIMLDKEQGQADSNDAYFVRISAYRLALSLVSINGEQFSKVTRDNFEEFDTDADTYIEARVKPVLSWSTSKLSAYLDAFQQFERKTLKLTTEVQNPNFWKASV